MHYKSSEFLTLFFLIFSSNIYSAASDYIYKDRNPSYNSFGQVGIIQNPSADIMEEGSVYFTLNRNDIWKYGSLTVTPFSWLEASYFYYRPDDLYWSDYYIIGKGDYLDKGFNVKFSYTPINKNYPKVAIGLDDFAGTGYFAKEYIVFTKNFNSFSLTLGAGTGKFSSDKAFKNPLSYIDSRINERPILSENLELGGTPLYDTWGRGPVGIFGGFEFYIPNANGLKLKIENDPFNYFDLSAGLRFDADPIIRKKESDINIGLSYPLNDFISVDASFIKGNTFNLTVSIGTSFNKKLKRKKTFKPIIENKDFNKDVKGEFYRDLLNNLNKNNLFLQTAQINKNSLSVAIQTDEYRNHIMQSSRAAYIADKTLELNNLNINKIEITNINVGVELNKISFNSEDISKYFDGYPFELIRNNTQITEGVTNDYLSNEFKPSINFPQIFTSYGPALVHHIGSPARFYYGGLELEHNSEIQFSRNLIMNTKLNLALVNTFDEKYYRPDSPFLQHVRTDLLKYLQQGEEYISQMQLDYIWSPYKNIYAKTSIGLFEKMFGGIGGEVIYRPFESNFSVGAEFYSVKQRSFKQRFQFFDYKTNTGHINFHYFEPKTGIHINTSYGKYLAKDKGYTIDISRQTKSGFRGGFFFSKTDVTVAQFGEGSFDKGFYFQIPLDLLGSSSNSRFYNFKIKSLTRDGGAKLDISNNIFSLIHNSNRSSIDTTWNWNEN